jgi:hypothetical protein
MVLSNYLDEYANRAVGALGGEVEASITVREHGFDLRAASSSASAARCDQAEVKAGDGPCIDAMTMHAIQVVPDIKGESRWDDWRRQSESEGFLKAVAVPAQVSPGLALTLNLYSRAPDEWPTKVIDTADACAGLIAAGVRLHLEFAQVEDAVAGLYRTMSDAFAVEEAVGAVMEANDFSDEQARELLRSAAEQQGVGQRSIAESILRSLATGVRGDIVDGRQR